MNIDIRSIPAFKNISDASLSIIKEDAQLLSYEIGAPLFDKKIIPNKVLIVISGEVRLLHEENNRKITTVAKLSSYSFIGLASILRAKACENVTASTEVVVMALSDKLIIQLYQNELDFKKWCEHKAQPAEILELAQYINNNSSSNDFSLNDVFQKLKINSDLKIIKNGENLQVNNEFINIIGSANIPERDIGQVIKEDTILNVRGILPVRILQIPSQIYKELYENKSNLIEKSNQSKSLDVSSLNIKASDSNLDESMEKLGQYDPNKKFKLIKATGIIRESLACLQMISQELGLPYRTDTIEKILRDTAKEGKKPTMHLLGGITASMGLHSTITKIDAKLANRIPSPSIIAFGESFAVVKDNYSNLLEIASPSQGVLILNQEEVQEKFETGVIELLLLEKHEQTPNKKFGLQWLLPVINKYRVVLLQVLLASAVVQLFTLANPLMIQVIIDKVISQRSMDTLQILGIALVVVTISGSILSGLRTFLFTETTNRIDTRLGAEVIDHLLRLPLNYFDQRPVGELGSRIAELEKIRNFLTGQALTTILDSLFSVIYIAIMCIYSWLLTLIALGVVPIQMLITFIGTPLIRKQIRDVARENAKTQSHLVEVLTGVQTVKAQNVENISRWKWQELYSKYISKSFQKTITGTALNESSQTLQKLSQLLVLWIGARLVLEGQLSLGQLIAFRIISGYVTQPLLRLTTIWQNIQELRVSFERLADIIDSPEEANEAEKEKIPLPSISGAVEFENISFAFSRSQPNVLNNINLKVQPGQFIGIVGQSGSGKSTLTKLLPRLYKPETGRVMIDGYDIDKVELYSLRRQIGIVPQEPLLFAGSINDNIALTDPEATSDEIVKAAKIADAHEFVMCLKDGYSSNVGERGSGLSGGQKQRIAIARTLLRNPKLLIMDEATSALDYETERKVCEGIRKTCEGSTVFFITHRLSTVKNSDLIVMLHQGSIVETGTHEELMELKGRYFALYLQQESS